MPITEQELQRVKEIILTGAKSHFPASSVQFQEANASVVMNADDEELIRIELLYIAENPVLDGHLMNTLWRVIDEPIIAAGVKARTMVNYIDINDPTWQQIQKPPFPPSPVS